MRLHFGGEDHDLLTSDTTKDPPPSTEAITRIQAQPVLSSIPRGSYNLFPAHNTHHSGRTTPTCLTSIESGLAAELTQPHPVYPNHYPDHSEPSSSLAETQIQDKPKDAATCPLPPARIRSPPKRTNASVCRDPTLSRPSPSSSPSSQKPTLARQPNSTPACLPTLPETTYNSQCPFQHHTQKLHSPSPQHPDVPPSPPSTANQAPPSSPHTNN